MMQRQVIASLRSLAVSSIMCEEEADICLSRDARLYSDLIYGIISNDSDCAIMRGVRWIPVSSLTLQWQSARLGQPAVHVDICMRAHFQSTRERIYGSSDKPAVSVSTPAFIASVSQPLVLVAARCQVWTNAAVMAALSLSNYSQLVNVAMLAGNDFTRDHTHLWGQLMLRTPGRNKADRWALFVTQQAQRDKRAEEYDVLKGLLSQSLELRRAFRQSRAIYEGTDADEAPVPAAAAVNSSYEFTHSAAQPSLTSPLVQPASSPTAPRLRARVFQVVTGKAHGFLRGRTCPYGLFYHQSKVVDGQMLSEGDEVEYDEADNERLVGKKQAVNVTVVRFSDLRTKGVQWEDYRPPVLGPRTSRFPSSCILPSGRSRAPVIRITPDAGYGFLGGRTMADSLFFHQANVLNAQLVSVGDEVEYDRGMNDRDPSRLQALRIQVVRFNDEATRGMPWVPKRVARPLAASLTAGPGRHLSSAHSGISGDASGNVRPVNGAPDLLFYHDSGREDQQLTVSDQSELEVEENEIKDSHPALDMPPTHAQPIRAHNHEMKEQPPASSDVESMTAALDAMNIHEDDLASIRHSTAIGQLPSDTLSCIVRQFEQVAVYIEQLHPGDPSAPSSSAAVPQQLNASAMPAVAPLDFSSLLLPPTERITRPIRAAFALLCGKRHCQLFTVVGHTFRQLDALLVYDEVLPHYLDNSHAMAAIPLLSVPDWPVEYRLELFVRPFGGVMDGGVDLVSRQILRSSLPLSLRLPVLACRFMLHAIVRQGCSLQYCLPLIDSLVAMFLVLFAVEPALSLPSSQIRQLPSFSSTVPHLLFVRDTGRLSFPLMLAGGLASIYQSVCSNVLNLSQMLRLPADVMERLPPHRLMHGPLLLSLLQDAVPQQIANLAVLTPASSSSSLLHPPCVSLDLLRFRVVRSDMAVSSTSSSHTLLQAVTASFTNYYHVCRTLVYAAGDQTVDELDTVPSQQLPIAVSVSSVVAQRGEAKQQRGEAKQHAPTAATEWKTVQQREQQRPPHTQSAVSGTGPRRPLPVDKQRNPPRPRPLPPLAAAASIIQRTAVLPLPASVAVATTGPIDSNREAEEERARVKKEKMRRNRERQRKKREEKRNQNRTQDEQASAASSTSA